MKKEKKKSKKGLILLGLIIVGLIVLIGQASALEFDNIKTIPIIEKDQSYLVGDVEVSYKELWTKYPVIEVDNAFGLGQKVFQGAITKHTESCGSNCESILEVYHSGGELIQDIRFIGDQPISYDLFISDEYKDELVNDYETQCVTGKEVISLNGTKSTPQECSIVLVGSHLEKVPIWKEISLKEEVAQGNYRIKVIGEIGPFESTDWQIKVAGSWLENWAIWDSSVIAYYKLDETSGAVIDSSINGLNGVNNASTPNVAGKINTSYNFDGTSDAFISFGNNSLFNPTSMSISLWVKAGNTFTSPESYIVDKGYSQYEITVNPSTRLWSFTYGNGTTSTSGGSGGKLIADVWTHIAITVNGSVIKLYQNGTETNSTAQTLQMKPTINNLHFGRRSPLEHGAFNGTIDEVGLWSRALTSSEITHLYNSGNGLSFEGGACFLEYNGANQTITCNTSLPLTINYPVLVDYKKLGDSLDVNYTSGGINYSTSITLTTQKNFTIYRQNDTGNYTQVHSWDYKVFETAEYFVASTISGATNPFNITFDANSQITIAYLNYNGTNYLGSISSSGDTYTLSRANVAPSVTTATNLSFYWNITQANGFNYATDEQNQTVSPIVINETCGVGMYIIRNITLLDELTQAQINGTSHNSSIKVDLVLYSSTRNQQLSTFSHNFVNTNPASFCIDNNLSGGETYSMDIQIQYSATNYSTELYNIYNTTLSSSTLNTNLSLYDLPTSNAQEFKITVRDTSYLPINGALVQIERKYIDEGLFKITEIPKTDARGITSASLEIDNAIYNFYVYEDGILISSFTNMLAVCQTPLVSTCEIELNAFQTGVDIPNYEDGDDFNFTLGYNSTSRIVSTIFNIPSEEPATIMLEVISQDTLGTSINSSTLTSASGTISVLIPNSFGNSTVMAKVYKNGIEQGRGNIKLDQKSSDIFGVITIFLALMVMLTLVGMGVSNNPIITGVFLLVGVMVLFGLNLVENNGFVGATATILYFAIAVILIIIKAARRT